MSQDLDEIIKKILEELKDSRYSPEEVGDEIRKFSGRISDFNKLSELEKHKEPREHLIKSKVIKDWIELVSDFDYYTELDTLFIDAIIELERLAEIGEAFEKTTSEEHCQRIINHYKRELILNGSK